MFRTAVLTFLSFFALRAAENYVRVNQIGYEPGVPGRAYLMSRAVPATTFTLRGANGKTVFSGEAGPVLGAWGKFTVSAMDFNIATPGVYTIAAGDATSPPFLVDVADRLYADALANTLRFYQAQRDGPDYISSQLRRAPAHLNDRKAAVYLTPTIAGEEDLAGDLTPTGAVIDASGGWFDAGDYLKFVQTHSYVVALMLIGVRDFPKQMGSGSATSDFTAEAKFGLDWLQKMWDDRSKTLYYQVGIGSGNDNTLSDHDMWRLPEADDTWGGDDAKSRYVRNRPVLVAGPAGSPVTPNLAGRLAADFALCYRVFRKSDPAYANKCLASAEHIFDKANTSPTGRLLTAAPFGFYGEQEWRDDLELGAAELAMALAAAKGALPKGLPHSDPVYYLRASAQWASAYIAAHKTGADTLNLYDVSGLAHFELHRAISAAGHPAGLAVSRAGLVNAVESQLRAASEFAAHEPFNFGRRWRGDTAAFGTGLAVLAQAHSSLSGSRKYAEQSRRWEANVLGANAWGVSFIVGAGTNFPRCIHHQIANLLGSHDGTPPVLSGAVVEGPGHPSNGNTPGMKKCPADGVDRYAGFNGNGSEFLDDSVSYATVEPAIDLTAPSFLMFAWRMAGAPGGL